MINWRHIIEPSRVKLTEADSPRLIGCEHCGTEGCGRPLDPDDGTCVCRYQGYDGNSPINCEDACPYCEGTGGELIATEPVELEDLEADRCTDCGADLPLRFPCNERTCPQRGREPLDPMRGVEFPFAENH